MIKDVFSPLFQGTKYISLLDPVGPSMRQIPPTRPSSLASCRLPGKARSILFKASCPASCKLQITSCKFQDARQVYIYDPHFAYCCF